MTDEKLHDVAERRALKGREAAVGQSEHGQAEGSDGLMWAAVRPRPAVSIPNLIAKKSERAGGSQLASMVRNGSAVRAQQATNARNVGFLNRAPELLPHAPRFGQGVARLLPAVLQRQLNTSLALGWLILRMEVTYEKMARNTLV